MTTINYKGINLTLKQDAYIAGTSENPYYTAIATDNNGTEYELKWYPVENWKDIEDEAERCNWDSPDEVIALY